MDPSRKRKIRLVALLAIAVLLASALVYTSFSASTETKDPSQVLSSAEPGRSYEMTGRVVRGSVREDGNVLRFRVADRDGGASVPVAYTGQVPDPFREGREVIVTGKLEGGTFVAQRDSLVTKCPSKYSNDKSQSRS